jgi:hypothetical protein
LFEIHDSDVDEYVEMKAVMSNIDRFGVLHLTLQRGVTGTARIQ